MAELAVDLRRSVQRVRDAIEGLGRLAYGAAKPIVSLYDGNRQRQIADGADPERDPELQPVS